jgi:type IV secretory pathway TrbD component
VSQVPEGFEVTIHRSLTEPILFAGLPKKFALVLWTLSTCIVLGLYQLWFLPLTLAVHCFFVALARRDPFFFDVFLRAVRGQKRLVP